MHIVEENSPMLFDLDSPYMEKLRKMSSTIKDMNQGNNLEFVQKSSDGLRSSIKVPSIRLERIANRRQDKSQNLKDKMAYQQSSMLKSQEKRKKVLFYRQHSQPLQISHAQMNAQVDSSSNNQNVRKRLTSLQKYFQQTRSIQLPFATQNRINQNQRFLSQIKNFQMSLSRAKSANNHQSSPCQSNNNTSQKKISRLAETRPKPLKIHELESENVKKEKHSILVQKIMREKVRQYREMMRDENFVKIQEEVFARPLPLDSQINLLGQEVENIHLELKLLKRQSRQKQQKIKLISDYFAFLN